MYPKILQKIDNFIILSINKYANYRWYNSPITKKIVASRESYLNIAKNAKEKHYPLVDAFEQQSKYKIDSEWLHSLALHTQVVIKKSDICYQHGRLLYSCLRKYFQDNNKNHLNIVETGTARGFSALCMAKALDDALVSGKIMTYDVLPHNERMYWNCIDDHEGKKTRAELLNHYKDLTERYIIFHQGNTKIELPKLQTDRIHFAFLDSAHNYQYLIAEFLNIETKQRKGDIIFFDDYTPKLFPNVVKVIDEICKKYNYSKEIIQLNENRGYVIAEKL